MARKYGSRTTKSSALAAQAFAQEPDKIVLEEEATMEGSAFQDFCIFLYGPPKIGKSTLFANVPGVYFLPTETGFKFIKVRKTPIKNWKTFTNFVKAVEKKPKFCKTVTIWCIDTVDRLSKYCMQYVCGREGISHPTDQDWGKGWEAYRDEFEYWISRLGMLGPGLAFISHETQREIISHSMKITKDSPSLPKTTYTIVNNLADVILHMSFTGRRKPVKKGEVVGILGDTRCLYTKPTATRDAGDRTGLLPSVIKFKTEKGAIKKLMSYFEE